MSSPDFGMRDYQYVMRFDFSDQSTLTLRDVGGVDKIELASDLSGNGYDATQQDLVETQLPSFETFANGKKGAKFDGVDDYILTGLVAAPGIPQPATLGIVAKFDSLPLADRMTMTDGLLAGVQWIVHKNGNEKFNLVAANISALPGFATPPDDDTNPHIFIFTLDGANSMFYLDGSGTSAGPDDVGADGTRGLALGTATGFTEWFDGKIAEVFIVDSVLPDSRINEIGNLLGDKYGITWTDL